MSDPLTPEEEEHLEECMGDVSDLMDTLHDIEEALQTATTVEGIEDFKANLVDAKKHLKKLDKEIDELLVQADEEA